MSEVAIFDPGTGRILAKSLGLHSRIDQLDIFAALGHNHNAWELISVSPYGSADPHFSLLPAVITSLTRTVEEENHRPLPIRAPACRSWESLSGRNFRAT